MLAPAIDQGLRPLCVPIAVPATHEACRTQPPEPLAPDALWSSCVASGTASREGTTLEEVASALRSSGQPPLADWPFNTTNIHQADLIPAAAQGSIWHKADMSTMPVANDGIEDAIEGYLANGHVVALIVEITTEFEQASSDGTIEVPPLTAPKSSYHAVLVVGARTHEGVRVLLVRNSWGNGWGAGGFGWLPLDYLIAFGVQFGVIDPSSLSSSIQGSRRKVGAEMHNEGEEQHLFDPNDLNSEEMVSGVAPSEEIDNAIQKFALDASLLRCSLHEYQSYGAKFALVQRRVILGDEMGLGKTIEALAVLSHLRQQGSTHFFIVCPTSVLANWEEEIGRHTRPETDGMSRSTLGRVRRVHGKNRMQQLGSWIRNGGIAITTFNTLRTLEVPKEKFAAMIVDEAHFVKNPMAKRTQAVRLWLEQAEIALLMTGTPIENRISDLRNLVRHINPRLANSLSSLGELLLFVKGYPMSISEETKKMF